MEKQNMYPIIDIPHIQNPNRFYAVPILGGLVKMVILIPVGIWIYLIFIAWYIVIFLNSIFVLFSGKYWSAAYEINTLLIKLIIKTNYFWLGITNNYPGFDGTTKDFSINIPYPEHSSRLFAFPIIGGIVRFIGLIPYCIYTIVIIYGAIIGAWIASLVVLFTGKYPEGFYEMSRDSIRLEQAMIMYMTGLSDTYPSWWISMKHKVLKIIFIVIGVLMLLHIFISDTTSYNRDYNNQVYQQQIQSKYHISPIPTIANPYNY